MHETQLDSGFSNQHCLPCTDAHLCLWSSVVRLPDLRIPCRCIALTAAGTSELWARGFCFGADPADDFLSGSNC